MHVQSVRMYESVPFTPHGSEHPPSGLGSGSWENPFLHILPSTILQLTIVAELCSAPCISAAPPLPSLSRPLCAPSGAAPALAPCVYMLYADRDGGAPATAAA